MGGLFERHQPHRIRLGNLRKGRAGDASTDHRGIDRAVAKKVNCCLLASVAGIHIVERQAVGSQDRPHEVFKAGAFWAEVDTLALEVGDRLDVGRGRHHKLGYVGEQGHHALRGMLLFPALLATNREVSD